jgi:branched-chain amino acid aminotransferase
MSDHPAAVHGLSTVWINGRFLPAAEAQVSAFDRSFLYGDGLFATVRVTRNRPVLWRDHWARLLIGANRLRIRLAPLQAELEAGLAELLHRNHSPDSLLRVHVSRGPGRRGYSVRGADSPAVLISQHPLPPRPPGWRLVTASVRLPLGDPLTALKSANKLPHILARMEAEDQGADAALLLNAAGEVSEADSANLFWIAGDRLGTPPVAAGALDGVTRAWVLNHAAETGLAAEETTAAPASLRSADGVFATLSSLGLVPVLSLDGHSLQHSEITGRLLDLWRQSLQTD